MITGLNVARLAKLIALLGFVLPWVLVSCAGEPVGRLTGVDLATGGLTLGDSGNGAVQHGGPDLWVAVSLLAVVGGLVASFLATGRRAVVAMAIAAIIALIASALGVSSVGSGVDVGSQASRPSGAAVGGVDLQYGYFITVAGLLTAIGACGVALGERDRGSGSGPGP